MSKYAKKLGSDQTYKRPKKTFQEQLSADEIAKKLQGYEKVDDIAEVPLNTHIRYFKTNPDGTQVFRTGGFLHNKQDPEKFVMLSNGKNIWSVQVKDTVFFKKMSHNDELDAIHALYKKKLNEKDEVIDKLKKYIRAKISNNEQITNNQQQNTNQNTNQPQQIMPRYISSQNIPRNTTYKPIQATSIRVAPKKVTSSKYKSSGSKSANPGRSNKSTNKSTNKIVSKSTSKSNNKPSSKSSKKN